MLEELNAGSYEVVNGRVLAAAQPSSIPLDADTVVAVAPATSNKRKTTAAATADPSDEPGVTSNPRKKKKRKKKKKAPPSDPAPEAAPPSSAAVPPSAWDEFSLHPLLVRGLAALGFSQPTPVQRACLPEITTKGRDLIASAETGSGKTLAFGLPVLSGLLHDPPARGAPLAALVLTPTRELALQVADHLRQVLRAGAASDKLPLQVGTVVGGMSQAKQERVLSRRPEVLVCTVGRLWALVREAQPHLSQLGELRYLVFDEADRMVERGHFAELKPLLAKLRHSTLTPEERAANRLLEEEDAEEEDAGDEKPPPRRVKRQTLAFSATLLSTAGQDGGGKRGKKKKKKKTTNNGSGANEHETGTLVERLVRSVGLRGAPAVCDVAAPAAATEGAADAEAPAPAAAEAGRVALPAGLRLAQIRARCPHPVRAPPRCQNLAARTNA